MNIAMMSISQPTTDTIAVLTDPFEIVSALCDEDEWDLALRIARDADRRAGFAR